MGEKVEAIELSLVRDYFAKRGNKRVEVRQHEANRVTSAAWEKSACALEMTPHHPLYPYLHESAASATRSAAKTLRSVGGSDNVTEAGKLEQQAKFHDAAITKTIKPSPKPVHVRRHYDPTAHARVVTASAIENLLVKLTWSPEAREAAVEARRNNPHRFGPQQSARDYDIGDRVQRDDRFRSEGTIHHVVDAHHVAVNWDDDPHGYPETVHHRLLSRIG